MSEQLNNPDEVCRMPPHGTGVSNAPNAASGDAAYNTKCTAAVGRLRSAGVLNEVLAA